MTSNKLISQLTKKDILQLPGFAGLNKILLPNLKNILRAHLVKTNIFKRGVRVNDYLDYCKKHKLDSIQIDTSIKQPTKSNRKLSKADINAQIKQPTKSNRKLSKADIDAKIKGYKQDMDEYTELLEKAKLNPAAEPGVDECIHYINNYEDNILKLLSDKYNKPELKTVINEIKALQEEMDDYLYVDNKLRQLLYELKDYEYDLNNNADALTEDELNETRNAVKQHTAEIAELKKDFVELSDDEFEAKYYNKLEKLRERRQQMENEINKLVEEDKNKRKRARKPKPKLSDEQKAASREMRSKRRREKKLLNVPTVDLSREEQFDKEILLSEKRIIELEKTYAPYKDDERYAKELQDEINRLRNNIDYVNKKKKAYIAEKSETKKSRRRKK